MRKLALVLALLVTGALVFGAQAQTLRTQTYTTVFTGTKADSTSFSLADGGADTTSWIDLQRRAFPCEFEGQPQLKGILSSTAAAGDSIGVVLQYSPDKTNIFSKNKVYFSGASPQIRTLLECGSHERDPAMGGRYVRFIVSDENLSSAAAYTATKLQIIFIEAQ
jgi:hypothetical protein